MLEIATTWAMIILSGSVLMAAMIMLLLTFLLHTTKNFKGDDAYDRKIIGMKNLRFSMFKVFLLNTALLLLIEAIIKISS